MLKNDFPEKTSKTIFSRFYKSFRMNDLQAKKKLVLFLIMTIIELEINSSLTSREVR